MFQVSRCPGLNRRIPKTVAGSPDVTYDYYYNEAARVLEARKGSDTDPYEQYVWDGRFLARLEARLGRGLVPGRPGRPPKAKEK